MGDFAFSTKLLNIISIDIKSKKAGFRPAFYNENLNYITSVGIIASKIPTEPALPYSFPGHACHQV